MSTKRSVLEKTSWHPHWNPQKIQIRRTSTFFLMKSQVFPSLTLFFGTPLKAFHLNGDLETEGGADLSLRTPAVPTGRSDGTHRWAVPGKMTRDIILIILFIYYKYIIICNIDIVIIIQWYRNIMVHIYHYIIITILLSLYYLVTINHYHHINYGDL